MDVNLVAAANAAVDTTVLPLIRDTAGEFARVYSPRGPRRTSYAPTVTSASRGRASTACCIICGRHSADRQAATTPFT
jgi:hypothetical protein